MQRQGLTMPELKLTAAQTSQLEKLAEKLAADQTALQAKYPPAQGAPNPEAQAARAKLTEAFTAEVNKVLNDEQKKTWAARPQRGGPGGGGMGGMGGAGGPPGGAGGPPRGPGGGAPPGGY
jgi:Spy/CpxP family protein refolding chaperone